MRKRQKNLDTDDYYNKPERRNGSGLPVKSHLTKTGGDYHPIGIFLRVATMLLICMCIISFLFTEETMIDKEFMSQPLNSLHLHNSRSEGTSPSRYSILPKTVYTVIGKESSGTKFVSEILRDALELHSYREGGMPYEKFAGRNRNTFRKDMQNPIQVQHISLPQGSTCQNSDLHGHQIVDVILPAQCSSWAAIDPAHQKQCYDMAKELNWHIKPPPLKDNMKQPKARKRPKRSKAGTIRYPSRYFIDINAHKEWYDSQGVEQYIIIVTRDENVSFNSRVKSHCRNVTIAKEEEKLASSIINDAINTYILEEDHERETDLRQMWDPPKYQQPKKEKSIDWLKDGEKGLKIYDHISASLFNRSSDRRRLESLSENTGTFSFIPSKNRVVLVSYESLMTLKAPYIKMLYKQLRIESDRIPTIKDGNAKYVSRFKEGDEIPMTSKQKKKQAKHLRKKIQQRY
jgi:hypothetical protein